MKPDRCLDGVAVRDRGGVPLCEAEQRLDVAQAVIVALGRPIGAQEFRTHRIGDQRHGAKLVFRR